MRLRDCIERVFILAYREDTQQLEAAIAQSGFAVEVLRQQHQAEFQDFSSSYLCLLNHRSAWERVVQANQLTLIVEADFVPVINFGDLPLPFNAADPTVGIVWLYTCAPQLYSVSPEGFAEGYSTAMVAYIVTPNSAKCLVQLAESIEQSIGAKTYSTWDSTVEKFLRTKGFKNYIPFQNYGEHGGKPNPEHRQHGLSSSHRADVLYNKLAFLPLYAESTKNPAFTLLKTRSQARVKGIARLVSGKYLRPKIVRHSSVPMKLIRFAVGRHFHTSGSIGET
jgi:GR25 family glycosyltransferase involved in LPS biosynthesis